MPAANAPSPTGTRLAIIDEDPHFASSIARLLRSNGYDVVTFSSPNAFLRSLGADPPDVVLVRADAAQDVSLQEAIIRARWQTLTPREREVSGHVVQGYLNKQIAALLGTAEKTVKVHRSRAMTKMQAHSVVELLRMLDRLGVGR